MLCDPGRKLPLNVDYCLTNGLSSRPGPYPMNIEEKQLASLPCQRTPVPSNIQAKQVGTLIPGRKLPHPIKPQRNAGGMTA